MKDLTWIKEDYIAHRGLHTEDLSVPENSMLAFKNAIELGYSIELDLNMLFDGTIVVFHDFNLKRLTGLDQNISKLTYDDIKDLKLYDTNEHIPLLSEVLNYVDGKVPLLIELKPFGDTEIFCQLFYDTIKDYQGKWAVFSFNPGVVRWFKNHHPEIIRGQITEYFKDNLKMKKIVKYLMKTMFFNRFTKPDFVSYRIHDLPNKYVDKAKQNGLTIISYAARTQEQLDFVRHTYDNVVFEYFIPKK